MEPESLRRFSKQYRRLAIEALIDEQWDEAIRFQTLNFKQYLMMERALVRIMDVVTARGTLPEFEMAAADLSAKVESALAERRPEDAARWLVRISELHGRFMRLYRRWFGQGTTLLRAVEGVDSHASILAELGTGPATPSELRWDDGVDAPSAPQIENLAEAPALVRQWGAAMKAEQVGATADVLRVMRRGLRCYESRQAADSAIFADHVARGDASEARLCLDRHRLFHRSLHNQFVDWVAEALSEIYKAYGYERFCEIMRETGQEFLHDFDGWVNFTPEQLLDSSVFMQLSHPDGELEVDEDDEKYIIRQFCGTGGRLMREGKFDGEGALARIEEAGPAGLGRPGMPTYCAHVTVWNTLLTAERYGRPIWVLEHSLNGSCEIHIYKDPDRIPQEYLERIGISAGDG